MNNIKNICYVCLLAGITSCGVSRKYQRPDIDVPDKFRTTDTLVSVSTDTSIALIPYKEFFADQTLLDLIEKGLAKNYDLAIAIKQVEYAEQAFKQTKWGNVPTVSASIGNASVQRPSDNSLNGAMIPQFLGQSYITDYSTTLQINWEADIWGKIKNRKSAALADFLQTEEAKKAVQTRLVANIAQAYYNLLMLDKQLEITNENIKLFESSIKLTELLRNAGDVTTLAVQQQEAALEAIQSGVSALEANIAIQENALSLLTGENPGKIDRSLTLDDMIVNENLPTSFPSEILANRPDIKQAELQLIQTVALENIAHANMYPSFSISAQGGLNSVDFSDWFNIPGSLFASLAGSLTTPILQGKQLKTQYKQSQIVNEQAELKYKQVFQSALGEISDILIQIDKLKPQEQHTKQQIATLTKAVDNAKLLYTQGISTYLDVLTAQNSLLEAELNLTSIEVQRHNTVIGLYRALGGGWK